MQHPQYMLNPGDMFSVEIDKVLFATGAPKGLPRSQDPKFVNKKKKEDGEEVVEAEAEAEAEAPKAAAVAVAPKAAAVAVAPKDAAATPVVPKEGETVAEAEEAAAIVELNKARELAGGSNWWDDINRAKAFDPTKPYRTPWRPRYYLSAFAFIPQYLEVNHNIGHAVYLRDPVAKPGISEVCAAHVGAREVLMNRWTDPDAVPPRDAAAGVQLVPAAEVEDGGCLEVYFRRVYINADCAFEGVDRQFIVMKITMVENIQCESSMLVNAMFIVEISTLYHACT